MLSDLRFALRSLARSRGFTVVTVLTLALGIGSAAAIFSVTEWILFRANSFPEDIFMVGGITADNPPNYARMHLQYEAYTAQAGEVGEFARAGSMAGNVVVAARPVATSWRTISANLFPLLGIHPAQGRGFLAAEERVGSDQVVIVSHRFWQRNLGGGKEALGRKVIVGSEVCTIVGILAEGQAFPGYFWGDVFRPLAYHYDPKLPWSPVMSVLLRLKTGVGRDQATAILSAAKVEYPANMRAYYGSERIALASFGEINRRQQSQNHWILLGAVAMLYGIACLNASNLGLVRMLGRRREISVRLALGSGRGQLLKFLLCESAVLAILAAIGGALVANWLFPILLRVAGNENMGTDLGLWNLSPRVVAMLGGLTVLTGAIIALLPALRLRRMDISSGLKDGGAAVGESRGLARLRGALVVIQVAVAIILLAGAGLMVRTLNRLQHVNLGIDPARRVRITLGFPADYPEANDVRLARLREIQAELERLPGVRDAGFSLDFLLSGYAYLGQSFERTDGTEFKVAMAAFSPGFPDPAGLQLRRGRWAVSWGKDLPDVMVNEAFVRARWPNGEDPVGQWIRPKGQGFNTAPEEWKGWQIAGVVGDVRASAREMPVPYIFFPENWSPAAMNCFVVRLNTDFSEEWASLARRRLYAFDPRIAVNEVDPLIKRVQQRLWAEKMADSVLRVLSAIALLLTIAGIFSVLAYTVDRRMNEFGVRLALGATRGDLVGLVMRRGLTLSCIGVVLGMAGAVSLSRFLKSLLFETAGNDPGVMGAVAAVLLVASVFACILPARRATKVDISKLLRSE